MLITYWILKYSVRIKMQEKHPLRIHSFSFARSVSFKIELYSCASDIDNVLPVDGEILASKQT